MTHQLQLGSVDLADLDAMEAALDDLAADDPEATDPQCAAGLAKIRRALTELRADRIVVDAVVAAEHQPRRRTRCALCRALYDRNQELAANGQAVRRSVIPAWALERLRAKVGHASDEGGNQEPAGRTSWQDS